MRRVVRFPIRFVRPDLSNPIDLLLVIFWSVLLANLIVGIAHRAGGG